MPHSLRKIKRNVRQYRAHNHQLRMTVDDLNRQIGKLRDSYAGKVRENTLLSTSVEAIAIELRKVETTLSHPLHRFTSRIIAGMRFVTSLPARYSR